MKKIEEELNATASEEHPPRLDVVINDYAQRMGVYKPSGTNETEYLNSIVSYFNTLAITFMNHGLIVIMLAQVQRTGEIELAKKKRAKSTMLAGLNSLDRDGHAIIINHSDDNMRLSNLVKMQVVKNRAGPVMDNMVDIKVDSKHFVVGMSMGDRPSAETVAELVEGDGLFEL